MGFYRPTKIEPAFDAAGVTPSELLRVARHAGITLRPFDVLGLIRHLGILLHLLPLDKEISGFIERRGVQWVIGVNSLHHPNRQRFTAAHELAHYCLHRDKIERLVERVLFRADETVDQAEWEANRFAADLLMPVSEVKDVISSGERNVLALAKHFSVSPAAMKFRVENMGYQLVA